jgi:hypothetical protein
MNTLACSKAERMIVEHLDEGLKSERLELLENHLRQCSVCRRLKEQTDCLLATVQRDIPEDPGEEFWTRLDSSFDARLQEQDLQPRSVFPWKIAGTVAAAAMLVLSLWLGSFVPRSPTFPTRPPSASIVIQELFLVYSPLSESFSSIDYDSNEPQNGEDSSFLSEDTAFLFFDSEDDPIQVFL